MSMLTRENLLKALESISEDGSLAKAGRVVGMASTATIWNWIAKARQAKENNDRSFWWLKWREIDGWWIDFLGRARDEQRASLDALVRSQTKHGLEVICIDPSSGYPLQARDPQWIGRDDEYMKVLGFDPARDRFLWNPDGTPVLQTKIEQVPAAVKIKTMSATVPGWGERIETNVNIRQAIVQFAPSPWTPRKIVDVEFRELPAPKSMDELKAERVELLKRQAAEHLADPNRVTKPSGPVPYTGSGRPSVDPFDVPERTSNGTDASGKSRPAKALNDAETRQPPAELPQAPLAQPVPSYVRRRHGQPTQQTRPDGSREPMSSSADTNYRRAVTR